MQSKIPTLKTLMKNKSVKSVQFSLDKSEPDGESAIRNSIAAALAKGIMEIKGTKSPGANKKNKAVAKENVGNT